MIEKKRGKYGKNYQIVSEWGVLSSRPDQRTGNNIEIRLTQTAWFGKAPKWDLRNWTPAVAGQGVVIGDDEDLRRLRDMLISVCDQIDAGQY